MTDYSDWRPFTILASLLPVVIANAKAAIREQEVFGRSTRPRGLVLLAVLQVTQFL